MVRYLSASWFQRLREHGDPSDAPGGDDAGGAPLVLRQVVTDGPEGEVRYDVVVAGGRAVVDSTTSAPADLTFTSDYATASAIAAGRLSTQAALSAGRIRVSGDVTVLGQRAGEAASLDPVPAELRAATEY